MTGSAPLWDSNQFTIYMPHVAQKIQNFLEGKAVWDPANTTGFKKFHPGAREMRDFASASNRGKVPWLYRVPVTTLVGYYDPSPAWAYRTTCSRPCTVRTA